jgi:lipoyl(octanoyl) transferase
MRDFTDKRDATTPDEIWLLEHPSVFTQGQAGKAEHILNAGDIPVIQTDRGGQVTYHGPGQLVVYLLLDLRRLNISIRTLVSTIEQAVINLLAEYGIEAYGDRKAPGVYVNGAKICAIGLRVRHGCTYHGIAFNINMDLEPYARINPCGFSQLPVTQTASLGGPKTVIEAGEKFISHLQMLLNL